MANNYTQTAFAFDAGTPENAKTIIGWLGGENLPEALAAELRKADDNNVEQDPKTGAFSCRYGAPAEAEIDASVPGELSHEPVYVCVGPDGGDLEATAIILAHALRTMPEVASPISFTWASWCSKGRVGEFSGGACLIVRGADPALVVHGNSSWTHEDQQSALADGWGVFENTTYGWRVERFDELFASDAAAQAYVAARALNGDPLAQAAVQYLAWAHGVSAAAKWKAS